MQNSNGKYNMMSIPKLKISFAVQRACNRGLFDLHLNKRELEFLHLRELFATKLLQAARRSNTSQMLGIHRKCPIWPFYCNFQLQYHISMNTILFHKKVLHKGVIFCKNKEGKTGHNIFKLLLGFFLI